MPNILVIRFSSLGDVILTTPVYKNIKEQLPDSKIFVAVKKKYAGVLENNPAIDAIIPLEDNESLFKYLGKIRSKNIEIIVDLHNNLRSRIITLFGGAKKVIRLNKAFWARRLLVQKKIKSETLHLHTFQRYLNCLKELGIKPKEYAPEIFASAADTRPEISPRFIIVQTAFLGDAVLTTPLVTSLRDGFPNSKIDLLCTPEIKDVFQGIPAINEILLFDKKGKDRGIFALWRWKNKLRFQYDVALLPHRSFKSALLVWLAQIPKRIGFDKSEGRIFLNDIVPFDWKTHDSERNLQLLRALGIQARKKQLEISVQKEKFDFEKFLNINHLAKETILVGMNPGSVWKTKRWLPEYFAAVADELTLRRNCKVLLFGSPKDKESVDGVVQRMKSAPINLCSQTDLKELTAAISHLSLFITNDSGPMHIACALKVPVVAIFGPTTRELGFFPLGEKSTVVELDIPCRPCSLHGGEKCPLGHFKCMKDITPDMVIRACEKFLKPVPGTGSGSGGKLGTVPSGTVPNFPPHP